MTLDVNAYLGHFAFRRLRSNTAPTLLARMDAKKIDRAVVSSASAITYRNAQAGNDELADEIRSHRDRLIPFAVINPAYAGWRDDLKTCVEQYGMKGLRLYPRWHNYALDSAACLELIDAATELGLIISIPMRVEDNRERSWLIDVPDLTLPEVAKLITSRPKARFWLLNGLGFIGSPLGRANSELPKNYAIECSRLDPLLANEFGQLVRNLGADRLLFGTGMPFSEPDPVVLKMELLDVGAPERAKILGQNAANWLSVRRGGK